MLLNETKTLLVSAIIAKSQDIGKESDTNVSTLSGFSPLTSLSNILPILNDRVLRNYKGSSQFSLLISLEKHFSRLGINLFQF